MARNVWQYALLGGVQGGAQGLAQGMAEEQRFQREKQLMAEREAERRRYLEEQQEGYLQRDAARIAARGGSGSGTGGSRGGTVPMTREAIDEAELAITGRTAEEQQDWLNGKDMTGSRLKVFNRDGTSSDAGFENEPPANFDDLRQKRLAERDRLRKAIAFGKDYKDIAEGDLIERAGGGDADAQAGLLANRGKGRKDGLAGGVGVFDALDGGQSLNAVGTSAANENNSQAGKYAADAKKIKAEVDDALKAGAPEKLHNLLNSVNKVLEDPLTPADTKTQYQALRNRLGQAINSAMDQRDGVKPAEGAPKPAAARKPSQSPYAEGQRLKGTDGKTYVVRNGKPELVQ